ncbi:Uma2 family endonuclease [Nocardia neocaledoniensis]|uniref:Uma2 family endonuclease n=1 Tax=Nocardia neocaledoniensis TaxID=236511 RepID=UPI002454982A|nr:Uma2 family endonuclease [Nocardia neocaledoniensis]
MTAPWPDHLLTLADWDSLAEDNSRMYELVEGVLIVSPRPTSLHQRVIKRLAWQLEPQLAAEWEVLGEVEVVIDRSPPPTVRVPDLCVVPAVSEAVPRWEADEVTLAVEVLSPGTRRTDRITKFAEYAEAGIEHYWIIDLEAPVSLTAYRLAGEHYEVVVDANGPTAIELLERRVTIDPAALVAARG